MVRKYKKRLGSRKYMNYTAENLEKAVIKYRNKEGTLKGLGEEYGIPHVTLYRKVKGLHMLDHGGQTYISKADEKALVNSIVIAADWGFPLEPMDIKLLAQSFFNRTGRTTKFKDNLPGQDWYEGFMKRHKAQLAQRVSQSIKLSRAKTSPETINKYFDNLSVELEGLSPEAIINYDETNFVDDPGKRKVVVRRESKRAEKIEDHSKAATSVMFSATAAGKLLPVYIVYKADHVWNSWTENGPAHARYNRSKSGWFDAQLFNEWFLTVALPYFKKLPPGPKVLIGDNLASHISLSVITLCQENDIKFVLLPPNSTNYTQPLDVAVFGPVKRKWRKVLREWKNKNKGTIPKNTFPRLLKATLDSLGPQLPEDIRSGFEATGIVPLCRDEVLKRLPREISATENSESEASFALQEMFKEARYGKKDAPTRGPRKKLDIRPGKSVSAEELCQENLPAEKLPKAGSSGTAKKLNMKRRKKQKKISKDVSSSDSDESWEDIAKKKRPFSHYLTDTGSEDEPPIFGNESDDASGIGDGEIWVDPDTERVNQKTAVLNSKTTTDKTEGIADHEYDVNDFVIVVLTTSGRHTAKEFYAQIVSKLDDKTFICTYLRQHSKIEGAYVFPWIKEEYVVDLWNIKRKLPQPETLRRGAMKFAF